MDHRSAPARLLVLLCLLLCLLLSACTAMLPARPMAPEVKVDSVKAEKITLTRQNLVFRLKVTNPNNFDLPLQTLSFVAAVDGVEIAQGMSIERVTIPARDSAQLDVHVSSRINKLLGQLLMATNEKRKAINYDVRGFVKLANWPARIAFNTDGALENPALQ